MVMKGARGHRGERGNQGPTGYQGEKGEKGLQGPLGPADQEITLRIQKLEDAITTHLIESGEIRSDIRWIKKAFGVVVAVGSVFCGGVLVMLFKMIIHVNG